MTTVNNAYVNRRYPAQFDRCEIRYLAYHHIRVILEFMGIPMKMQPNVKPAMIELMARMRAERPADAQKAYELVVLKKVDNAGIAAATGMSQDAVDALIKKFTSMVGDLVLDKGERVDAIIEAAREGLLAEAKHLLAENAVQYRKVEIHAPMKKPIKMKHTLPDEFEQVLQLANQRVNILLVGPAGCGKTFLAERVAEALGFKKEQYASQSCSEGVNESAFTGWLLPVEDHGKFSYVESEFVRIYENGGVFLFDEIDASDPNMLTFLNQAIANDHFYIPHRHKKPRVTKHPDFVCIAAANTFGAGADAMYVGRNQLDAATLDRFRAGTVAMDYSERVEEALISPELLDWGRTIRERIGNARLRRIMSTRVMLDFTRMVEGAKWTLKQVEEAYFMGWSKDEINAIGRTQA